jgi:predicted HicB family RNase H-like nuclease
VEEMSVKSDRYAYRITWSDEDQEYVGLCTEFPSLSWLAGSQEGALTGIRRVVAESVADMTANGEDVPEPFSTRKYSGRFMVRVPPEIHRRIAETAAEEGVSINRLVSERLAR